MHADDVRRMRGDARRVERLALEARGVLLRQHQLLDRERKPGAPLARLEHGAEAARPELANQLEVADDRCGRARFGGLLIGHGSRLIDERADASPGQAQAQQMETDNR